MQQTKLLTVVLVGTLNMAALVDAANEKSSVPPNDGVDAKGETLLANQLPDDFNWEQDFDTLPGSQSIYAGMKDENAAVGEEQAAKPFEAFPSVVNVKLHANCDVIPFRLPVDFIFKKIIERFDYEEPGMVDIEPGENVVLPEDAQIITGDLQVDVDNAVRRRIRQRNLRGSDRHFDDGDREGGKVHRRLGIDICPDCEDVRNWKKCVKNKCKGSSRRRLLTLPSEKPDEEDTSGVRRRLLEEDIEQEEDYHRLLQWGGSYGPGTYTGSYGGPSSYGPGRSWGWGSTPQIQGTAVESTLSASNQAKTAADEVGNSALEQERAGKHEIAALLAEKALLMEEKAAFMAEKALLMEERQYMMAKRESMLEASGATDAVQGQLKEAENEVLDLKAQLQEKELSVKSLNQEAMQKEYYERLVLKYEKEWEHAVRMLGDVTDELKSVGKMEEDLNKVVGWFSKNYGCQLGVVVERLG